MQLTKGKMKGCSLSIIVIFTCCICRYTSVKIKPELKKNILKFGYCMNYKYKGMLAHSIERFYVATNFILPTVSDLKFINTVHQMHNITTPNERLFVGELKTAFMWYVNKHGAQDYAINVLLY